MDEFDDIFGGEAEDIFEEHEPEYTTPIKTVEELQLEENKTAKEEGRNAKKMTQFDSVLDALDGRHAERFNHLLTTMGPAEFIKAYTVMLSYVRPKFKALEPKVEKPQVTELTIVRKTIGEENRTLPKIGNKYSQQIKAK